MDTTSFTEVVQEAFATAKCNDPLIETIEVFHPSLVSGTKRLELCFCVDNTGSQGAAIESIKTLANNVSELLVDDFETIGFSLISFRDELPGETVIVTGAGFVSLATFQTAIDTLEARGGADSEENGLGAVVLSGDLPWSEAREVSKCIFLISDVESHERGATQEQAINALTDKGIVFCYQNSFPIYEYNFVGEGLGDHIESLFFEYVGEGLGDYVENIEGDGYNFAGEGLGDHIQSLFFQYVGQGFGDYAENIVFTDLDHGQYQPLADATEGLRIPPGTDEEIATTFTDLLKEIVEIEGEPPLYLVNQFQDIELTLENGEVKLFKSCGFKIELPEKSDNGIQDLNIAIDNTNGIVTDFLERAVELQNQSIRIIYRPYLASDLTQPQMNPPLVLYLSNASSRGSEVVGTARFDDVINRTFLSEKYTLERFPALA